MNLKRLYDTPPWEWPRDVGKTFLEVLNNRRAKVSDRLIAAELAGDCVVVNDEIANSLIGIARNADEPEQLRVRAAIALGPVLDLADIADIEESFDPDEVPITEDTFHDIQDSLRTLYFDPSTPKELRRRVLEVSVRATSDWHAEAIAKAYASSDREWVLTAVFGMRHVRGFDQQILEALNNPDLEIHYEAVRAAGNWELAAAWEHVATLVGADPPKELLLAAIDAVAYIRPAEAGRLLVDLADSEDEEIAEAADEAMSMAEVRVHPDAEDSDEDEDEDAWLN